jgi:type I restriction enzyme S subunit
MANIAQLLTEHMDIWTAADTEKKSGRGRASGNAGSVYGVKKLRELILELAVRGKLVPQNLNDEPASELLKRIQAEKAKLTAEGKLKKEKSLAPIGEDEKPFELPKGWEWARLGNLAYIEMGQSPDSQNYNQVGDGIPFFQGKADFGALYPTERYWCNKPNKYSYPGDILLSIRAPVGPTNIANKECCIGRGLSALRPIKDLETFFLLILMRSFEKHLQSKATGTTFSAVSRNDIDSLLLPICSLNQQRLIVTKVNELMALCDQLEQQHSNAQEAHEILVSQLLATLTQSQNAAEFNANWQRIYAHFDVLFTTEASIDALKQTLLQLAVMGKLMPQDPSDEPASELLKRIQAEKAKLIAEGKLKKEKPLAPITKEEKPFELPKSWEWVRLATISTLKGGFAFPSTSFKESGEYQVLKMGNIKPGQIRLKDKPAFVDEKTAKLAIEAKLDIDDIVITMTGTVGKRDYVYSARVTDVVINDANLFINQRLCAVKPYIVSALYLDSAMKNDRLMDEIFASATGTANQANIGMVSLANWLIPIPPLVEQYRIVAQVDALMVLCDQLNTRIQQANQQQQVIANALVAQAVA